MSIINLLEDLTVLVDARELDTCLNELMVLACLRTDEQSTAVFDTLLKLHNDAEYRCDHKVQHTADLHKLINFLRDHMPELRLILASFTSCVKERKAKLGN